MCMMSMVYDYVNRNIPPETFTSAALEQFKKVKQEVQKLDEILNQKDCVDPEKAKYDEAVKAALIKQFQELDGVSYNSSGEPLCSGSIIEDGFSRKLEEES